MALSHSPIHFEGHPWSFILHMNIYLHIYVYIYIYIMHTYIWPKVFHCAWYHSFCVIANSDGELWWSMAGMFLVWKVGEVSGQFISSCSQFDWHWWYWSFVRFLHVAHRTGSLRLLKGSFSGNDLRRKCVLTRNRWTHCRYSIRTMLQSSMSYRMVTLVSRSFRWQMSSLWKRSSNLC